MTKVLNDQVLNDRVPAAPCVTPPETLLRSIVEIVVMAMLLVREVDVVVVAGNRSATLAA